jgi:hypothetical protein
VRSNAARVAVGVAVLNKYEQRYFYVLGVTVAGISSEIVHKIFQHSFIFFHHP